VVYYCIGDFVIEVGSFSSERKSKGNSSNRCANHNIGTQIIWKKQDDITLQKAQYSITEIKIMN
jgi:hypothetical protein